MTTTADRDKSGRFTSKTRAEKLTGVPDDGDTFKAFGFDWAPTDLPLGSHVAAELSAGYAAEVSE
jgi:hypothetical protein